MGAIVDEPRFHGHLTGRQNLKILAAARGGDAAKQIGPALAGGTTIGPGGGPRTLHLPPMPTWAMVTVIVGWIVGWSAIGA